MPGKRQHDCSGQVLVVVLLGMVLLGGMIFYVVNVGDQSNRRLEMQNAADSAAISGAAWMARSMNVIAMNNVAATRMLALVPILDAFPLSTKMGHEEVRAWVRCLEAQLERVDLDGQHLRQYPIAHGCRGAHQGTRRRYCDGSDDGR